MNASLSFVRPTPVTATPWGGGWTSLIPVRRPGWLPSDDWPFETGALRVDGVSVAVTVVGHGTLLFVHSDSGRLSGTT